MSRLFYSIGILIAIALHTSPAHGQLSLNVDTVNQLFFLTGTDTATGNGSGFVVWRFNTGSVNSSFFDVLNADSTVSLSTGSLDNNGVWINFPGFDTTPWVDLAISTSNSDAQFTITGTGPDGAFSYANLGPNVPAFEAAIGTPTVSFPAGTGQSDLIFQSVPEPSATGFFGFLLALTIAKRRRAASTFKREIAG